MCLKKKGWDDPLDEKTRYENHPIAITPKKDLIKRSREKTKKNDW